MISMGSATAFIPLANLNKASKLFGIAQFTLSVSVTPPHDGCVGNTGCMLAIVPTASSNSGLVAKAYTDVYATAKENENVKDTFVVVSAGTGAPLNNEWLNVNSMLIDDPAIKFMPVRSISNVESVIDCAPSILYTPLDVESGISVSPITSVITSATYSNETGKPSLSIMSYPST